MFQTARQTKVFENVVDQIQEAILESQTQDKQLVSGLLEEMSGDVYNLVKAKEEIDQYKNKFSR